MYYFINDVETSGRHKWYHDVVSCGLVVLDESFSVVDKFYGECCPYNVKHFDLETVAVHGLSLNHLQQQQSSHDLCVNVLLFLDQYRDKTKLVSYVPFVYHAQNRFDFLFMYNMFLKNGLEFSFRKMFHRQHSFSTIKMARQLGMADNGLDIWASRIGEYFEHHNSLSDAMMAAKVLRHLVLNLGATLDSGFEIKKAEMIADDDVDDSHKKKKRKKVDEDLCSNLTMQF